MKCCLARLMHTSREPTRKRNSVAISLLYLNLKSCNRSPIPPYWQSKIQYLRKNQRCQHLSSTLSAKNPTSRCTGPAHRRSHLAGEGRREGESGRPQHYILRRERNDETISTFRVMILVFSMFKGKIKLKKRTKT